MLLLDLEALQQMRRVGWPCVAVWVSPPSAAALAARLKQRGVEDPAELELRLKQARALALPDLHLIYA